MVRLFIGDARRMKEVEDGSVHLVVTSPPYWQIKDYGHPGQIGFYQSYERYVNDLNLVWQECYRALHAGCRLCVNVGDQFTRAIHYGRYKLVSIQSEVIRCCEALGMDYMGTIVWQKVTSTRTTGGAAIMGSFPFPRNGMVKVNYEYILLFRKLGEAPRPTGEAKQRSMLTREEWNTFFSGHWKIPGARQRRHVAAFPEEIPRRLIRMFSFVGETVLDPFAGSGTTLKVAADLERLAIGYEINPEFAGQVVEKCGDRMVEVNVTVPPSPADLRVGTERLPYVFRDPHGFDRVVEADVARRFAKR